VAVSADSLREQLLNVLTIDENDFDIIVVESIAHGYSRIKELMPHLIVVFFEIDDVEACQLLAMLRHDDDVAGIPVVRAWPGAIGTSVTKSFKNARGPRLVKASPLG
jgi:hypothetical protein